MRLALRWRRWVAACVVLLASSAEASAPSVRFVDCSADSGLSMVLHNDASDRKRLIETMTGGVALFDFDGDGLPDIYFVNGAPIPSLRKDGERWWNRLYRNRGDFRFEDVTQQAGVAGQGYDMGVAAGDYDGDGHVDLFVTGVRGNTLYRNQGDGRFADVTAAAGLAAKPGEARWAVSAGWLDDDGDGDLDLFVANYVRWDPATEPVCGDPLRKTPTYCHPDRYQGTANQLFRNQGNGRFVDVSQEAGVASHIGKGMGLGIADVDGDGRLDVFVPNDTVPNFLFFQQEGGGFREGAFEAGVALNDDGLALSSMGVDLRDIDNDGLADVFISALANETWPLFRNLGNRVFAEITYPSGIGKASLPFTGWGLGVFDFNQDGWKDLFVAGGDVNSNTERYSSGQSRQANRLLLGVDGKRFVDGTAEAGLEGAGVALHRGAAFGDLNGDGCLDVVLTRLNQTPLLLRGECGGGKWMGFALRQQGANRLAYGARITVELSDGRRLTNAVQTTVGYASSSDPRVHFGLGEATVERARIRWPDGVEQVLDKPSPGRWLPVERTEAR
ncbi:MAG: CRTAC1 family protein [Bryobacterales bacterium]|nr:CRTAC1 family protein [Bryobacterales bacterium]